MKKLVKILAVLLVAVMMLSMTAFSAEDTEISDETLVVGTFGEPVCLYTIKGTNMNTIPVSNLINDGLTGYDPETGEIYPLIADSWEQIEDCVWQFKIHQGIIAYDGTEFTANDVLYSIKEGQQYHISTTWADIDLEKTEVIDDYTINIATNNPMSYFPRIMANGAILPMVSESSVEAAGGSDACMLSPKMGVGPYKFVEWVDGEYIILERNDDYYGELPYYKTIQIRFISDNATRIMELESGMVDLILNVPATQFDYLASNDAYTTYAFETDLSYELIFNTTVEPYNNTQVRQAIAKVIDQDIILTAAGLGYGVAMDNTNIAPSNPYYVEPSDEDKAVDVDAAKALLAEAGYPDGFTMKLTTMAAYTGITDIVQAELAQIGITVELDTVDMATLVQSLQTGQFDAIMGTEIPAGDLSYPLHKYDTRLEFKDVQGSTAWGTDELNALIDIASYGSDEEEITDAMAQIQEILRDNVPLISFYCYDTLYASKSTITGAKVDIRGMAYLRFVRPVE